MVIYMIYSSIKKYKKTENKTIYGITAFCVIISFATILPLIPFRISGLINIVLLIVPIVILYRGNKEIEIFCMTPKNETGLSAAFYAPPLLFAARSLWEFKFIYSLRLWLYLGIGSIVITIIFYLIMKKFIDKISKFGGLLLVTIPLTFGLLTYVNCIGKPIESKTYETKVINKSTGTGTRLGKTYYLEVAPWIYADTKSILVSATTYQLFSEGDNVDIWLYKGILGLEYYKLYT
jgi:hypothetical protein